MEEILIFAHKMFKRECPPVMGLPFRRLEYQSVRIGVRFLVVAICENLYHPAPDHSSYLGDYLCSAARAGIFFPFPLSVSRVHHLTVQAP